LSSFFSQQFHNYQKTIPLGDRKWELWRGVPGQALRDRGDGRHQEGSAGQAVRNGSIFYFILIRNCANCQLLTDPCYCITRIQDSVKSTKARKLTYRTYRYFQFGTVPISTGRYRTVY
jgi:hypothetical protein